MSLYNNSDSCAHLVENTMIDTVGLGISRAVINALGFDAKELTAIIEKNAHKDTFSISKHSVYRFVKSFTFEGKKIAIRYYKNLGAYFIPDYYITVHLSQFLDWNEFKRWLQKLIEKFYPLVMNHAEVYRLDCCLETCDLSLDYVYQRANRRYASVKKLKMYGSFYEV